MSSLLAIASIAALLSVKWALVPSQAGAASIRDAEIEHTIRLYASPLLRSAGFEPFDVRLHIINDRSINAFVAGGQRIFLTSGLLMAADQPVQIAGVLGHEIGHITGGHLARLSGALDDAPATDREPAGVAVAMNDALGILRRLYTLSACGDPFALAGDTVPQNASMLVTDFWLCRGREVT